MTPEQLEREAADRVRRMGYPDELSDAERWHCFREDAQLVAASNDVLWERVRELGNRLADAETEKIERGTEIIRLRERVGELGKWLGYIADESYVGKYAPLKVIEIYRKWAQVALAGGSDG